MEYLLGTLALALALRSLLRLGAIERRQRGLTDELEQARLAFIVMQNRLTWLEGSYGWTAKDTFTPSPAGPPHSPNAQPSSPGALPRGAVPPASPDVHPSARQGEPATETPEASPMPLETWLGARGAALLGAALLVLAGLYFFRYSIEHGYLTPPLRVALGALAGSLSIVAGERIVRRRHELLANGLAGAGIAILYITTWASFDLYHLVNAAFATVALMGLTALACGLSAWRRSTTMATLGLLGGFATPVMLSTGEDRPLTLFAYLLLLDGGLLLLARRQRWPGLALACVVATAGYEWAWTLEASNHEAITGGMTVFALFGAAFAVGTHRREETLWQLTRVLAVAVPFLFAIFVGAGGMATTSLAWLLAYLGLLLTGAFVLARLDHVALGPVAAVTTLGVIGLWLRGHPMTATSPSVAVAVTSFTLGLSMVAGAIGLVPGLRDRADDETHRLDRHRKASPTFVTWAVGGIPLLAIATAAMPVLGMLCTAALAAGLIAWGRLGRMPIIGAVGIGVLGLTSALRLVCEGIDGEPTTWMVGSAVITAALSAAMLFRLDRDGHSPELHALSAPVIGLLAAPLFIGGLGLSALVPTALGLVIIAVLLVARHGRTATMPAATTLAALTFATKVETGDGVPALAAVIGSLAIGSLWPWVMPARLRRQGALWRASAIGSALGLPLLIASWHAQWGGDLLGLPALLGATGAVTTLVAAEYRGPHDERSRALAREWLGGVTLVGVFLGFTLQLSGLGLTVGYALLAVAAAGLWRWHRHGAVVLVATGLFALTFQRLLLDPAVLSYAPRNGTIVLNWIAVAYGIPMMAAFGARRLFGAIDHPMLRAVKAFLGAGAVLLGFCWLNLAIVDAFSTGSVLQLPIDHRPGRDLTLSLGWALYALVLLGFGLRSQRRAPRAVALGLMALTCAKVFFVDLAHLQDLYRVSSLVGLSFALIAVSLGYQRLLGKGLSSLPDSDPAPASSR